MEPALECKARVLNVNFGHNAKLMNKCIRLMHYSQFIARINQNIQGGMSVDIAVDEAINYCIQNGILEDILMRNRSEVCHMLLTEFDSKKFARTMWNEGHESGYSEGRESGYSEGHQQGRDDIFTIMDEINRGNNTFEKLTELGYDSELVKKVLEKMNLN